MACGAGGLLDKDSKLCFNEVDKRCFKMNVKVETKGSEQWTSHTHPEQLLEQLRQDDAVNE